MIKSINIKSGFAKELPIAKALKGKELRPDLNILWGRNGSGKTTALQIAATFAFCYNGGWTRLMEPLEIGSFTHSGKLKIPGDLVKQSPGNCEATLDWDRAPVFFANGKDQSNHAAGLDQTSDDGMTTIMGEIMSRKISPKSSGQLRKDRLMAVLDNLQQGAPDFKDITIKPHINSTWRNCFEQQIAFLSDRPDDARFTVLMDEPERNMDIENAAEFWGRVVPHLTKYVQMIVATHHPFALRYTLEDQAAWFTSVKDEHTKAYAAYKKAFA